VFACLMLTGAALGDRFGRRRMYVLGLCVFVAGSAGCALSGSAGALILARVVQGAGAAVVLPLTLSPLDAGFRILVWAGMPMLVAPIAGALADRLGNRPFMVLGLILQALGLGWLAMVVQPGVGYGTLVGPLIVAGIGISMCFPTVANAVVASVPLEDSGVAAGTNNALRELGGVFGIAILAAVFAAHGSYASPASFIDGFRPAEWVAAAVAAVGVVAAILAPSRSAARALPDPAKAATVCVAPSSP
jgi:MFS family permease